MVDSSVHFFLEEVSLIIPKKKLLRIFLEKLIKKEKKRLINLNLIFCTDSYLLTINTKYLNHHYYTDVISFNYSIAAELIDGEIYISIDRIKENARKYGIIFQYELLRVIFHGLLHLCGYNDKNHDEHAIMKKKEEQYLKLYKQFVSRATF